jgi:adenylate cyclase
MAGWFRFRRFRSRLLALVVGLVAAAQAGTFLLVTKAQRANALARIAADLDRGARDFQRLVDRRIDGLVTAARLMSADYAIRSLFLQEAVDRATARSALESYRQRIGAPVLTLLQADGEPVADTRDDGAADKGIFRELMRRAENRDDQQQASGFARLATGGLHVVALVPVYAPFPEIRAWIGFAFPIDAAFAADLKRTTGLEATFAFAPRGPGGAAPEASTLAASLATQVAAADGGGTNAVTVPLDGVPYITTFRPLALVSPGFAMIALQRSLDAELAPARDLENVMLLVFAITLALAVLVAGWLARGVSQPVQELAAHTRHVAAGDYSPRLALRRDDELGQLATAFNHMTEGLAERDRVRDLLGKVVSPEIAHQLLQSDLKLGGEEREVTILFSDLRDFTALSERLPPAAVLALLNRYLDRMSAVVERHGGVIDKFIGDAIMALFGAPVAATDAPGQALATARAMVAALDELNRELAAEGRPPLALGIGINTARVVAGNMGSKTRLNYTVIGDGVNLAARLEALTKEPTYRTRIIASEATLQAAKSPPPARPLGEVKVKGKSEPVRIFALE